MDPQSTRQALLRLEYRCTCQASGDDWCWKKARSNVGGFHPAQHFVITSLVDSGWRFTQGPKGLDLFHALS